MKKGQLLKGIKKSLARAGDMRCSEIAIRENYYLLAQKGKYAYNQIAHSKEKCYEHVLDILFILERYHFDISQDELFKEVKPLKLSDGELKHLYEIIVYCCLFSLGENKNNDKIINFIRRAGFYDYKRFYRLLSELEKVLLLNHDYKISDEETRQLYVSALKKYAKKHKMPILKAAAKVSEGGISQVLFEKPHPIAEKLYFAVIFSFFAFLALSEAFVIFFPFSFSAILPFLLSLVPIYECSVYLTNYSYSKLFYPRVKPALNVNDIPKEVKTLAVITSLLNGNDTDVFEKIEQYYVSNKYDGLMCGILADLPDSDLPEEQNDINILKNAEMAIDRLCEKYGDIFFLFWRKREYCPTEGKFIAPERKRLAVGQLCSLLYTGKGNIEVYGSQNLLFGTKYLITLDSDTVLPPGTAIRMTAVAEHPLNRPKIDESARKVVKGHGILQPAVDTLISSAAKTPFSLISSGNGGVQSYRSARFDVYEEIFGKGIFCGKGIINCEAFCKTAIDIFPCEKILSHDVVEGCFLNSGMIPNIALYDSTPSNANAYYKRSDRWIRGDVQTYAVFKGKYVKTKNGKVKNPLSAFDKYKLFDNLRRDITPAFAVSAMIAGAFCKRYVCVSVAVFSLFYVIIPAFVSFLECVISGAFGVKRKFYSFAVSDFWYAFLYLMWKISAVAHEGYVGAKAAVTSLWRLNISGKNLLAWVSASQAEKTLKGSLGIYLLKGAFSVLCGFCFLLFVPFGIYRASGVLFILNPFAMYLSSKPVKQKSKACSENDRKQLAKYVHDMWQYFEDYVNDETNYLPPDNVSFIGGEKIAQRTSPTNIGLYLMSAMGAYYFGIFGKEKLYQVIEKTVFTVEKMKKYKGNLYNWYDITNISTLNTFVSFVDSGNFVCCMVCVKEGLEKIFSPNDNLVKRINALILQTDLGCMYDEEANMFYIGTDEVHGVTKGNHYDMYMSEARTSDFYAAAHGITKNRLLCNTSRTVIGKNGYMGLASWTGTAFEYFMPAIFLPVYKNSLVSEALRFAFKRQREYSVCINGMKPVYGTSESCFFEFDSDMNYQYKAHGVPSLALKNGMEDDKVISPYSSFLMLCMGSTPFENLQNLELYGAYGKYGFYEAVDFTESRVKNGYAVIKCFMSHHIGMSIAAACNYAFNDIFVRCFISNIFIKSSLCLTEEKIPTDAPVYKRKNGESQDVIYVSGRKTQIPVISNCVISNSVCRYEVAENGRVALYYGDIAISSPHASDVCDIAFGVDVYEESKLYHLMQESKPVCDGLSAEFYIDNAASARLTLSGTSNVFCIHTGAANGGITVMYFSPVCANEEEYLSHVCYCRLFTQVKCKNGILIYKRKGFYFAVCLKSEKGICEFEYGTSVSELNEHGGINEYSITEYGASSVENTDYFCPVDPLVFVKSTHADSCFLISCGKSSEEAENGLIDALHRENNTAYNKTTLAKLYATVLQCTFQSEDILRALLFRHPKQSKMHGKDMDILWKHGISGDAPICVCDLTKDDLKSGFPQSARTAVLTHKSLLIKGVKYDTVLLYSDNGYDNENLKSIEAALKSLGTFALLGQKNGIFAVKCESCAQREFFFDMSFYPHEEKNEVLRADVVKSTDTMQSNAVYRVGERGVQIYSKPILPWSFVYANEDFGFLLTTRTLGYTWFKNSRMGKITAWNNDPCCENGERVYLIIREKAYDLVLHSSEISFGFDKAVYSGTVEGVRFFLCVCCGESVKKINVQLTNTEKFDIPCEVCYKADVVLGEKTKNCGILHATSDSKCITVYNTFNNMQECCMYSPQGTVCSFNGGQCAVRSRVKVMADSSLCVELFLGVEKSRFEKFTFEQTARIYKKTVDEFVNAVTICTDDRDFDVMFNLFAKYQALYCRVYARCGFYQTGGAYGFRDQLQDMICIMYLNSEYAREHILRCACHQYEEGDVMHWWHVLPNGSEKGVRTRCSDDMLWLVYVTGKYLRVTGDDSILFTPVLYLCSDILRDNEYDRYESAHRSEMKESLYMHCVRAVCKACNFGPHGLPLFGSGDWNDGMNSVGGESVWLAWFLYASLLEMINMADIVKDDTGKAEYIAVSEKLYNDIENFAYNGKYYIRGTYADGQPLGKNGGCETDVIPQAFAAMYGKNKERKTSAMNTVWDQLYEEENKMLLLFKPPFDENGRYAGYISDYPQGIRENGGQYTHGAVWGAIGFFEAGMNDRAIKVLRDINPLVRSKNEAVLKKYKGEPYVFAGDVYKNGKNTGRCGWSWYSGAAGWYFTAVLEKMIGYKEEEGGFYLSPALCEGFDSFKIKIRKKGTSYDINVKSAKGQFFEFDGKDHTVSI